MEDVSARFKVELELDVNYRKKDGITEEYIIKCITETIRQHINGYKQGTVFNIRDIKLKSI